MRIGNSKIKKLGAMGFAAIAGTLAWSAGSVYAVDGWGIDLNSGGATASSVTLTLGGTGNVTLAPQQAGRTSGIVRRTISATIGASDGHTIKISGNPDLTGKNATNKILGVTTNRTLAQMNNQWGWYSADGDVSCSDTASYKAMSASGATVSSGALASETKKMITLCFGAKVNESQAADTYSNTIMISAVAQPKTIVTFGGITTMQEMTPAICKAASENDTAYLRDTRDNKSYWVTKMLDGNCWMSQNLDFDITETNVTTATSDVASNWTSSSNYPPQPTMKEYTSGTSIDIHSIYSRDLGDYVLSTPTAMPSYGCSSVKDLENCSSSYGFINVGTGWTASGDPNFYKNNGGSSINETSNTYDAHYLMGNRYTWNAATAGSGAGTANNTNANSSICPRGWRLPSVATGASTFTKGTYSYLLRQYGLVNTWDSGNTTGTGVNGNAYDIALSPLFFVRGGTINGIRQISDAGLTGDYYSSLAGSSALYAYYLNFYNSTVNPSKGNEIYRSVSRALRCFVQTP